MDSYSFYSISQSAPNGFNYVPKISSALLRRRIFCLHCDSVNQLSETGFYDYANLLSGIVVIPGSKLKIQNIHKQLILAEYPGDDPELLIQVAKTQLQLIEAIQEQSDLAEQYRLENGRILKDRQELTNQFSQYRTGILREIAERRKIEAALRISERQYRLLAENASDVIWIMDLKPKLKYVSAAVEKVYGWTPEEFLGMSFSDYTPADSLKKAFDIYGTEIAKISSKEAEFNLPFTVEIEQYRKDGSLIWVEIVGRILHDDFLDEIVFFGVTRDVSERKRIIYELIREKEKAEVMNRLKTNFLANMSHEIRTPLNGIMGFAEIITNETADEKIIDFAETIKKSGRRLLDTLNTVLDFAKLEAEKIEVSLQEVDVLPVLIDVMKLLSPLAQKKALQLRNEFDVKTMILSVDEKFFRNAISNIVANAVKFTLEGSIILRAFASVEDEVNYGIIEIEDTGIGIPENYLPVIFEEFRQVSEGRNRAFEGTGLGLTITKRFIEKMRGSISVRSKLNCGTTFTLRFPLAGKSAIISGPSRSDSMSVSLSSDISTASAAETANILFVDDDEVSRELVVLMLNGRYNVELAENSEACFEKLKHGNYDLILLDINLGKDRDGIEVITDIRAMEKFAKIPVVALTAFALKGDKEDFLNSGFDYYLSKPFTRVEIISLISSIIKEKK